jgi:histidyl-tRNA synthetase
MRFQPAKGMRDFLPEDAEKLQYILQTFRNVAERFGFRPMETPAVESFELLSAKGGLGEAVKNEIYYFKDKGDREIGLRFDMTMPLARIASDKSIQKPFKRYAIGKVWRYDNPQKLRYREFFQADIDIVGSKSGLADAEIVAATCEFLSDLGFTDYYIRFNSRKLIQKIFEQFLEKERIPEAFRIIDKLDKIGLTNLKAELAKASLPILEITEIAKLSGDLKEMSGFVQTRYGCREELEEIYEFLEYAKTLGIEDKLKLDLSLVRGLDYYTGLIYEVFLGENVSFGAGGRYDNLISAMGGDGTPATGISMGIDRLFDIMKEKKMLPEKIGRKVFVASVDDSVREDVIKTCQLLRKAGIRCEFDLMGRNLSKQMEYASAASFDYAIIIGKTEIAQGNVKMKNMKDKSEKAMTVDEARKILLQ